MTIERGILWYVNRTISWLCECFKHIAIAYPLCVYASAGDACDSKCNPGFDRSCQSTTTSLSRLIGTAALPGVTVATDTEVDTSSAAAARVITGS